MTGSKTGFATKRVRVGVLLGLAAWTLAVGLGQLGLWRHVDAPIYDAASRAAPAVPVDPRVVTVYVSDTDIDLFQNELGHWPWRSRMRHAAAARAILDGGARSVGYDIIFSDPSLDADGSDDALTIELADRDDDVGVVHGVLFQWDRLQIGGRAHSDEAAQALASEGGAYGASAEDRAAVVEGRAPYLPIDKLLEASTYLGHVNASPDHDFAIRRVPLFVRMDDRLYPSLAMRTALATLGLSEDAVEVDLARREIRLVVAPDDVIHIPVDPDGTMWIHFDRPKEDVPAIRYAQVDEASERGMFDGASVIVGVSVSGTTDTWRTPMDAQHQGFLIHAQIVENILTRRFVRTLQPDVYPTASGELALHVALLLATLALAFVVSGVDPRMAWAATFVAAALPLAASVLVLQCADLWTPPTTAIAALGGAGMAGVGYRQFADLLERRHLRRVYERYLSPAVLESVLRDPGLLELGGARKELTVFFSDIRGFTPYSETVGPMELTERLNEYYAEMIDIAHRHGATLDKLIGDSLMAFYGDPVAQPDHTLRAVHTALDTQARLRELTAQWEARDVHVFGVGIGIATGEVAVGNLGSERFVDYTVIGAVVNLAARLQGSAEAGEILIGPRAYEHVKDDIETEYVGERTFAGINGPRRVYRVLGRRRA